ncbi:MAG: Lrp/AsnC family transcriptional regulator [Candidatus Micrarchaeota archaeon]|nr:Lrp/AsnC family transcriptional regulator [Candidatus Micrarchaeota archaeon]
MAWKMDEIDRKIIELLRENSAQANAKIGKKVGLSEPATRRRIGNLVKHGIIQRFTIDVNESGGVQALVFISTSSHTPSEKVARQLAKEAGVGFIWETSGDMDIAITLSAPDMGTLNQRLDKIRLIEAIKKTKTFLVMKKWR